MTHEEILEMKAGRDMDALVAERAMGMHTGMDQSRGFTLLAWPATEAPPLPHRAQVCPAYSKEMAAAWEVFLRLPVGWAIERIERPENTFRVFDASCPYYDEGLEGTEYFAPTAPLAICRTALLIAKA